MPRGANKFIQNQVFLLGLIPSELPVCVRPDFSLFERGVEYLMKFEEKMFAELLEQAETYEDGELIFKEGTVSGWVYVVAYGEVEIYRTVGGKKVIIDHIHEGESLGELSFFDHHTRSAAARAVGKVGLMQFKEDRLMGDYEKLPDYFRVFLEGMALRMRTLIEKITLLTTNPKIFELLNKESKGKIK